MSIKISTSQFVQTKTAEIDGVDYKVRKIGAGTQLDLSREFSGLGQMRDAVLNCTGKLAKETDAKVREKLQGEVLKLSADIADKMRAIEEIYATLFDDGGDGEKSRALIHMIGADNVPALYAQIWGDNA